MSSSGETHSVVQRLGWYLDAAANMRTSQLLHRPCRLIPPSLLAAPAFRESTGWKAAAKGLAVDPAPQSGPTPAPHTTHVFTAVGVSRSFPTPRFWHSREAGLLFLFHLHGFAELAAYAAGPRTPDGDRFWSNVVDDWLRARSSPRRPAWHPFPMSGRIMAWCAALSAEGWGERLQRRMRDSLVVQARALRRSVEHDIGGNHVLRAVALVLAGVCLDDSRATDKALRLLNRQLGAQVLADGGHEERSTAYHRAIVGDLEDVQALLRQAGHPAEPWLDETVARMQRWLAAVTGPDGRLPLLNDAWEGPAVGRPLEGALVDLAESGYLALRGEGLQVVLDLAPVAPQHLPPHAHADVLSFVLWADGRPVVVDPGVLSYSGPGRDWFRSTRAHNTVEVDGADQREFWGPFRAAHMPEVKRLRLDRRDEVVVVSAEHDGYRRLSDPLTHRRTFAWIPDAGLVVVDRLIATEPHEAASFLHLAPGAEFQNGQVDHMRVRPLGKPDMTVEEGRYAPFLGTAEVAQTLVQRRRMQPGQTWGWGVLRIGCTASLEADVLRIARSGRAAIELTVD